MYSVYHQKTDLGIEAYCWQSRTAGGLVAFGKLENCSKATEPLQSILWSFTSGRCTLQLRRSQISRTSRRNCQSTIQKESGEPSDDTNVRNSVSQHVFQWLRKASMLSNFFLSTLRDMQRLIKAVASHGHRLLELHEAGQTCRVPLPDSCPRFVAYVFQRSCLYSAVVLLCFCMATGKPFCSSHGQ